jgi:hypothetical protein
MKLSEVRSTYYEDSATASTVARQLSFAGIAVIWVFSGGAVAATGRFAVSTDFFRAGFCLVIALALDFLQYVSRSLIWGWLGRAKEVKGMDPESEIVVSRVVNWPALAFFWLKLLAVVVAYGLLAVGLAHRLTS